MLSINQKSIESATGPPSPTLCMYQGWLSRGSTTLRVTWSLLAESLEISPRKTKCGRFFQNLFNNISSQEEKVCQKAAFAPGLASCKLYRGGGVLVVCGGPVGAIMLSLLSFFPPTGCRQGGAALGGLPASVLSRVSV